MSNGTCGTKCSGRSRSSIRIQVRLAWQVSRGWGQVWVPRRVQWAAMLEGVGSLGEWGHKCLLSAGSRVAASFLRGWS